MRCSMFLSIVILAFAMAVWLSGCGESTTEPDPVEYYTLSGSVMINGSGDPTTAMVSLYQAPQDEQVTEVLNSYPSVGFAEYRLMLFHPLKQEPIGTTSPDESGTFQFGDLPAATYIITVSHDDYVYPTPLLISLFGDENVGGLILKESIDVIGDIVDNTSWQTGSVYRVLSDVRILQGATLTIQDEVLILVEDDYRIQVFGSLLVDGTPTQPVIFRLSEEGYEEGDDWHGLEIKPGAGNCDITGAVFHDASTALEIKGGSVTISECLFNAPESFGVYCESQTEGSVTHSILVDGYTGLTSRNSDHEFMHNVIVRMANHGIETKDSSRAYIANNVILDCKTGIFSDWFTEPTIEYNLISGGEFALYAEEGFTPVIQHNEIRQQTEKGIYFTVGLCYPQVFNFNNFIDMPPTILFVFGGGGMQADTVFAQYNYWDGETATAIPDRIKDGNDHGDQTNPIGIVIFEPFLSLPVAEAGP